MKRPCFSIVLLMITMVLARTAYAQDGVDWNLYNLNPVFTNSSGFTWDRSMATAPMVVMHKDTLRMWYEGSTNLYSETVNIGYAWSLDGITWNRKADSPVLSARSGEWDYPHVVTPSVIVDGDTLRMWYGGGQFNSSGMKIGYAWSLNGIDWNRNPDPVIVAGQSWNTWGVFPGGVQKEGNELRMWFNGGIGPPLNPTTSSRWSVGVATSSDGINWTSNDEPVLEHGTTGDFDKDFAVSGTVLKTKTGYEMWYSGSYKDANSSLSSIGYATSPDGIAWTKYAQNPVLTAVPPLPNGLGDAFYNPHVVFHNNKYHIWFSAWHPGPTIAYATADNLTGIDDDLLSRNRDGFNLFPNYPNPFGLSTTIRYEIPEFGHVSLDVYDLLGKRVATLVDEYRNEGVHSIEFSAHGLSGGPYFIRLRAGGFSTTARATLSK